MVSVDDLQQLHSVLSAWSDDADQHGTPRNGYIFIANLSLSTYVRVTQRTLAAQLNAPERRRTLEIGNVQVDEKHRGQGSFKKFLQAMEEIARQTRRTLYVEQILNNRLLQFFQNLPDYYPDRIFAYDGSVSRSFFKRPTRNVVFQN
jgi:GNAT superfamily N-acetyltransferase